MIKRIGVLILVIALISVSFLPVVFATSVSVSASDKNIEIGDTVKVSIKVSAAGIGAAEGKFSYDSSVLEVTSVGGGAAANGNISMVASAEGSSSLSTSVTFKAKAEGNASVSVNISSVLKFSDYSEMGGGSGSTSITVAKEEAPPTATKTATPTKKPTTTSTPDRTEEATPTPSPTPGLDETGKPVEISGVTKYIWPSLSTLTLPSGYTDGKVTLQGEEIAAAVPIDGTPFNLVYASDAQGEDGEFYLVFGEMVVPFLQLTPTPMTYTIVQLTDEALIPEGFAATTITVGETEYPALLSEDAQLTLLYAFDAAGNPGLFAYSEELKFMERYYPEPTQTPEPTPLPTPAATPEPEPSVQPVEPAVAPQPTQLGFIDTILSNSSVMITIIALGVVIIAFAILLIVVLNSRKTRGAKPDEYVGTRVATPNAARTNGTAVATHSDISDCVHPPEVSEKTEDEQSSVQTEEEELPHVDEEETFVHIEEDDD